MPKISKETAAHVEDAGVMQQWYDEVDGYIGGFALFREDADGTPFFRGLPDDRCQSPHWGYVISGKLIFRYADGEETFEAGDAYYARPGHVPIVTAGTETVEFSPADELRRTMEVVGANLAAVAGV